MVSNALQKRKRLFDKFSGQLSLLKNEGYLDIPLQYERTYICPICLGQFGEQHLEDSNANFLTLEDAPPDSLGGSKIALTCKDCNSFCGHQIDHHLTHVIREIDDSYFYKGSVHRRKIIFEGGPLNVELTSLGDGTLKAYHRIASNHPTRLERFIHAIKTGSLKMALNLEPPVSKVIPERVNYALIKTNYVITFARFGYLFLLHPYYNDIRRQLRHPDQVIYPWTLFVKDQFHKENVGTYYIHNPSLGGILNVFALKTQYSQTIIAGMLPLPHISAPDFGQQVVNLKNVDGSTTIDTTRYDPEADLFTDWEKISQVLRWMISFR